jgi:hypothetical protein
MHQLLMAALMMGLQSTPPAPQAPAADPVEQALAEYRKAWKEARTLAMKASALHGLAVTEVRDARITRTLGKFLSPMSDDPDYVLAAVAAEELGDYKGDPLASSFLAGAMPTYRKVPRMQMTLVAAMGKNGSASLVPILLERVRDLSASPELAQAAATAIGNMPVEHALPAMLKEWADLNKKRFKETAYPIVTTALLASAQKMTGAIGTTVADFELWWSRNSAQYPAKKAPTATGT